MIIRECIEEIELNEGLRRNLRLLKSRKPGSTDAFKKGIAKSVRRNERGIEKDGQVNFANKRLHGNWDHQNSVLPTLDGPKKKKK